MRLGELLAYPPRDRMPAMLFGSTGMGKTRIVQREHGSRYRSAARHHPVAGGGPADAADPARARFLRGAAGLAMEAVLPVKLGVSNLR